MGRSEKSIDDLFHPRLRLLFTGGKGGVGKTTVAAAMSLAMAREGYHTLLTSTDPAHSLSDSFDLKQPVGHQIQAHPNISSLFLQELDAEQALESFRTENGGELQSLIENATYLDEDDARQMLNLAIPGLDEVMAFIQITETLERDEYHKIIVDTAPTGHALRLLHFPEMLDDWIKVLAQLRQKYFNVMRAFGAKSSAGEPGDWLLELKKKVKRVRKLLTSQDEAEFVVVTRPERMILSETSRLVDQLQDYGIGVRHLVINGLIPGESSEGFCARLRENQEKNIQQLSKQMPGLHHHRLVLQEADVVGLQALKPVSAMLFPPANQPDQ